MGNGVEAIEGRRGVVLFWEELLVKRVVGMKAEEKLLKHAQAE